MLYHKQAYEEAFIMADIEIKKQTAWEKQFSAYAEKYPTEAEELRRWIRGHLPGNWEEADGRQQCIPR